MMINVKYLVLINLIFLSGCGIKFEENNIQNEFIKFCEYPSFIYDNKLVSKPEINDSDFRKIEKLLNLDYYLKSYLEIIDEPLEIHKAESKKFKVEKSFRTRPIGLSTAFNTPRAILIISSHGEKFVYSRFLGKFNEEIKYDCIK